MPVVRGVVMSKKQRMIFSSKWKPEKQKRKKLTPAEEELSKFKFTFYGTNKQLAKLMNHINIINWDKI